MKKITFLKVLAYPASAYILLNAASQPVLAQMQEEPVPETQVEKNEILSEEIEPSETVDTEVDQTVIEPEIDAISSSAAEKSDDESKIESEDACNDTFAQYVEEQFLGKSEEEIVQTPIFRLFKASVVGDNLSAADHEIYNILKPQLEAVARGDTTYTKFVINAADLTSVQIESYTAEDLGVTTLIDKDGLIDEDASDAYFKKMQFSYRKVFEGLQLDMPSELYWFDKTSRGTYFPSPIYDVKGDASGKDFSITLKSLSFNFAVSQDYMDKSYDDIYHVDPKYGQSVQNALNNAKAIVDKYANLTDYEKLKAYVKELTDLSEYNHPAMDNNYAYGNPWQIIYLFDGIPDTKVVCEGYSKGFQYLCSMSTFQSSDIQVISVHGISGAGNGAGRHEWNIVHMPDGKNYVVDVTNSAADAIGSGGELILAGTEIGNIDQGYIFKIGNQDFPLQYNDDTRSLYKDAQLLLAAFNYQESNNMRVAVKINDYNLIEDEIINYEIVLDPGKASINDIFYDITFRMPGRDPQTFTQIQETSFNSVAITGDYSITIRAYDQKGNEASTTRTFTVVPALAVSLIPDHTNETLVNTDYILTAESKGKNTPIQYQFEQYRRNQWEVLKSYNDKNTISISSDIEGTYQIRVVARDSKGHTAVSNVLELKISEGTKPDIAVDNLYYKVGQTIHLQDAITVRSENTVTYFTKITDNATGKIVDSIPNDTQNDYTVEFSFLDELKRLVSHQSAKVYVLNGAVFSVAEKHVTTGVATDLLENVSVTDTYGKHFGPDSGLIHVTEIYDGPQKMEAADTVTFPIKGTYTVKYSFKDSLGLNWVYRHPVAVHDPISITCEDVYTPVGYDIDFLEGVKAVDENGNEVTVTLASIVDEAGNIIEKVDTSVIATYTVTYSAKDAYGLETMKTALFHVKTPPVITGETTVIPVNSDIDLLENMHAFDDKGNELKIGIEYIKDADGNAVEEWYTDEPRIYTVKYFTTDSDGVSTYLETELRIKALPVIEAQDIQFYQGEEFYLDDFISAKDADGNEIEPITDAIIDKDGQLVIDWAVLDPGVYPVTVYARDKDGIESKITINVTVLYNDLPEIDADDVWLEVGDEWDPWEDVTAYDRQDGNITDKVEIISVKKREEKPKLLKMARIPVEIDTSEPGIYDLVYRVVDRFGGETIKAIVVTITEKAPETQEISYPNPIVTNTTMPASTRGVPTGVHHDMMGYASMLVTSLGALMGINAFKRRQK